MMGNTNGPSQGEIVVFSYPAQEEEERLWPKFTFGLMVTLKAGSGLNFSWLTTLPHNYALEKKIIQTNQPFYKSDRFINIEHSLRLTIICTIVLKPLHLTRPPSFA